MRKHCTMGDERADPLELEKYNHLIQAYVLGVDE